MNEKREYNFIGFINETLAPLVEKRDASHRPPMLGIDEGLNNEEHVGSMCRRLMRRGIVARAVPLWYQQRITKDGNLMSVPGGSVSVPLSSLIRGDTRPEHRGLTSGSSPRRLYISR